MRAGEEVRVPRLRLIKLESEAVRRRDGDVLGAEG